MGQTTFYGQLPGRLRLGHATVGGMRRREKFLNPKPWNTPNGPRRKESMDNQRRIYRARWSQRWHALKKLGIPRELRRHFLIHGKLPEGAP